MGRYLLCPPPDDLLPPDEWLTLLPEDRKLEPEDMLGDDRKLDPEDLLGEDRKLDPEDLLGEDDR